MSAFVRARPVRVAFLVEDHEHSSAMISAIINYCHQRWGGRFNLIVPCEEGNIRASYRPWLHAYDPDVIYSYADIDEQARKTIQEDLCPSYFLRHEFTSDERRVGDYEPRLPINSLSSLSTLLTTEHPHPIFGHQQIGLVAIDWRASSYFIRSNFGAWPLQLSADLQESITAHTLITEEAFADTLRRPRLLGIPHTSEISLIDAASEDRNLIGIAQLCAWVTPRIEFRDLRWSQSLNLVVGESYLDRLCFWNTRSLYPQYLDGGIATLNALPTEMNRPEFVAALANFLNKRTNIARDGGNQTHITIRSSSLSASELKAVREKLITAGLSHVSNTEIIGSVDDLIPEGDVHAPARLTLFKHFREKAYAEQEILNTETKFRPPSLLPLHLKDAAPIPNWARSGVWAQDIDLERHTNHSRYHNVVHRWRLPRRLFGAGALLKTYNIENGTPLIPRVNSDHTLTLFTSIEADLPSIEQPADDEFFRYALCVKHEPWPYTRGLRLQPTSAPLATAIRTSDKGRYLRALLNRAGGLNASLGIFLCSFWLNEFRILGASPTANNDRYDDIVANLKKRLGASTTLETPEQWAKVAGIVIKESRSERKPARYMRFDILNARYNKFRDEYWKGEQHQPDTEWVKHELESLPSSVKYLCQRQILHQGHEWKCRRCFNNNWVSVEALKSIMTCDVCGAQARCPVNDVWRFKLDNYVFQGLREHGMLAYIWCLKKLSDKSQQSFFFSEPQEMFYSWENAEKNTPDAEFDLLVVSDGLVRVCEVKSSRRHIDLDKFVQVVLRLRPDIATLAVMEPSGNISRGLHDALQANLHGSGIRAEVLTVEEYDFERDPTLPSQGWEELEGE